MNILKIIKIVSLSSIVLIAIMSSAFAHDHGWGRGWGHRYNNNPRPYYQHQYNQHQYNQHQYNQHHYNDCEHNRRYSRGYMRNTQYYNTYQQGYGYGYNQPVAIIPPNQFYYGNQGRFGISFESGF
jgi:hypothetical protein